MVCFIVYEVLWSFCVAWLQGHSLVVRLLWNTNLCKCVFAMSQWLYAWMTEVNIRSGPIQTLTTSCVFNYKLDDE